MTTVTPARHQSHLLSTYTRTDTIGTLPYVDINAPSSLPGDDTRTTNSNPNWRQVIARGGDASSAYEIKRHRYQHLRGWGQSFGIAAFGPPKVYFKGDLSLYGYLIDPTSLVQNTDDVVLRDQALVRLKRKLARHNANVNVLVPLAEVRELRGTIRSIAKLSTGVINAFIDIKKTRGRSAFKYASDAWLNFSFGVVPMVADAHAISAAIANYMASKDHTVKLSGQADKTWIGGSATNVSAGAFGADLYTSYRALHTLSYRYSAGFSILHGSSNSYGVGSQFGLEVGALLPTFWELVPYSWIVDYFTTMGSYLDDVFISAAGTTRYVTLARKYTCEIDFLGKLKPAVSTSSILYQHFRPGFYDLSHFSRTSLSQLPHAALRVKTVDEVGRNAVNRLLNLSSLFISKSGYKHF